MSLSIPTYMPPLRKVTMSKVDLVLNPVAKYMRVSNMKNKEVAIAPHTICLMGSGYLAVNRFCFAAAQERSPHRLEETEGEKLLREFFGEKKRRTKYVLPKKHLVYMPPHLTEMETFEVIQAFLDELPLKRFYKLEVHEPFDLNGQVALVPLLVSLWKVLEYFEPRIARQPMKSTITETLRKMKLDIPGLAAVLEVTETGSTNFAQVAFGDKEREPAFVCPFTEKYNMIYIRTNLHDMVDAAPFKVPNDLLSGLMRDSFNLEELDPTFAGLSHVMNVVPNNIRRYSKDRLENKLYEPLVTERRMQEALNAICDDWKCDLQGFEVQQGGIIVMSARNPSKDVFAKLIDMLAEAIAVHSEEEISHITFDFLYVTDRARQIRMSDAVLETMEESSVVEINGKPGPIRHRRGPRITRRHP